MLSFQNVSGVSLAINDFSSGIMTASAVDENSTNELKGCVTFLLSIFVLPKLSVGGHGYIGIIHFNLNWFAAIPANSPNQT